MDDSYQPTRVPDATPPDSGTLTSFGGFVGRLPWPSLIAGTWVVWVLCIAYDARFSPSDDLITFAFGATVGVFVSILVPSSIQLKALCAIVISVAVVCLFMLLAYWGRNLRTVNNQIVLFSLSASVGFVPVIVVSSKLVQLISVAWQFFQTSAVHSSDSVAMRVVVRRLQIALMLIAAMHILEAGVLTVRVRWFHDLLFINPWLWITAPIAFAITLWALHAWWRTRSWMVIVYMWMASAVSQVGSFSPFPRVGCSVEDCNDGIV